MYGTDSHTPLLAVLVLEVDPPSVKVTVVQPPHPHEHVVTKNRPQTLGIPERPSVPVLHMLDEYLIRHVFRGRDEYPV